MIVGRVKGTAGISGRYLLEVIGQPVKRGHRRGEIRLLAIDHVTLERGIAVHKYLVPGKALDRAQRFAKRVFFPC